MEVQLNRILSYLETMLPAYFMLIPVILLLPYILYGIGLFRIAERCSSRNRWMAWVPIARKHLLAEIADVQRARVKKEGKLTTLFEIFTGLIVVCFGIGITMDNPLTMILPAILLVFIEWVEMFSYYYVYRLCDMENATIYFILGLFFKPLNPFFIFCCRNELKIVTFYR